MIKLFQSTDTFRTIIGAVAALVIGGTFLIAAAGPAIAGTANATSVSFAAVSGIVRVA